MVKKHPYLGVVNRVSSRLESKITHSTREADLNTDQGYLIISFQTVTQILQCAVKNRVFLKFTVNFFETNINLIFLKINLSNLKLEEQLSLKSFLFLIIFEKLYLVNFGLSFGSSVQNLSDCWGQKNCRVYQWSKLLLWFCARFPTQI